MQAMQDIGLELRRSDQPLPWTQTPWRLSVDGNAAELKLRRLGDDCL